MGPLSECYGVNWNLVRPGLASATGKVFELGFFWLFIFAQKTLKLMHFVLKSVAGVPQGEIGFLIKKFRVIRKAEPTDRRFCDQNRIEPILF